MYVCVHACMCVCMGGYVGVRMSTLNIFIYVLSVTVPLLAVYVLVLCVDRSVTDLSFA